MIYFILVILLIFPILLPIFNKLTNKKLYVYQFLLFFVFAPLFLFFSPFTTTQRIDNEAFVFCFSVYIICLIAFLIYLFYKYHKQHSLSSLQIYKCIFNLKNLCYLICAVSFLILLLFTSVEDHDSTYYLNISSNFANKVYSSDGIRILSKHYSLATMYFMNGSLFANNIFASYYLLNPIIYYLFIYSISENIIDIFKFKSKKYHLIILFMINFGLIFAALSQINYIVGMNLVFQSLILMVVILSFINKKTPLVMMMLVLGFAYFSPTGLLLSLASTIFMFVYCLLFKNWKQLLINIIMIFLPVILSLFYFSQIDISSSLWRSTLTIGLIYLLLIIQLFIYLKAPYFKINQFNLYNQWKDKKAFNIILLFLFVVVSILLVIFFSFIYHIKYTNTKLVYVTLVVNITLIGISIYTFIKKQQISPLIIFIFIIEYASLIVLGLQKIVPSFANNQSAWRLIFWNFGMGNVVDFFIQPLLFVFIISELIRKYKLNKVNQDADYQVNKSINHHHLSIKTKYGFKVAGLISFLSLFICAGVGSMVNMYSQVFGNNLPDYASLNANIELNVNKYTQNDINLLHSIQTNNYQQTYFSDYTVGNYLSQMVDITGFFKVTNNNQYLSAYNWNFDGLVRGSLDWNRNYPNDYFSPTDINIANQLVYLMNNFSSYHVKNFYGFELTTIDYVILNKYTSYYQETQLELVKLNPKQILQGERITIFSFK